MRPSIAIFLVCVFSFPASIISAFGEKPIWSKQATALGLSCSPNSRPIPSPDHRFLVEVLCDKHDEAEPIYSLLVVTASHRYESPLDEGAHELLWAPNSKSFFIDGSTNANSGFFVSVYQVNPDVGIKKVDITTAAQKDMCKVYDRDEKDCLSSVSGPEYNMSGLAWAKSSSAIYVFAEVPCGTSFGNNMCQVFGYKLDAFDGTILTRLSARETKRRWGKYAAWKVHVPEPPYYAPAK